MKRLLRIFIFLTLSAATLLILTHGTLFSSAKVSPLYALNKVETCRFKAEVEKCSMETIPANLLLSRKDRWMAQPVGDDIKKSLNGIDRVEYKLFDARKIILFGKGVIVTGKDGEREISWWIK